jgi:hypothetical protein
VSAHQNALLVNAPFALVSDIASGILFLFSNLLPEISLRSQPINDMHHFFFGRPHFARDFSAPVIFQDFINQPEEFFLYFL